MLSKSLERCQEFNWKQKEQTHNEKDAIHDALLVDIHRMTRENSNSLSRHIKPANGEN